MTAGWTTRRGGGAAALLVLATLCGSLRLLLGDEGGDKLAVTHGHKQLDAHGLEQSGAGCRDLADRHHALRGRRRARTVGQATRPWPRHCGGWPGRRLLRAECPCRRQRRRAGQRQRQGGARQGPKALKYFDDYRSKVKAQTIAGLGDKAYWDGYASLSVLKGDEYLRIAVIGVKNVLGAEEKLAADALPRM